MSNPPNERWQQIWDRIGTSSGGAGASTSGTLSGSTRTSDTAPFSYTLSGLGTYSGNATWSSSDYRAGQWGNGSYSFGSAVDDEHSEYAGDYVHFDRTATGTWVNDRSGISTSDVNSTFLFSGIPGETQSHFIREFRG